jgi:hypothetical protein
MALPQDGGAGRNGKAALYLTVAEMNYAIQNAGAVSDQVEQGTSDHGRSYHQIAAAVCAT